MPRFIPEHMTEAAVRTRLEVFMETDWRVRAEVLLHARLASEDKDVYVSYPFFSVLSSV